MQSILDGLPELAAKYPSVETLLNANVDFFFAGIVLYRADAQTLTQSAVAPNPRSGLKLISSGFIGYLMSL